MYILQILSTDKFTLIYPAQVNASVAPAAIVTRFICCQYVKPHERKRFQSKGKYINPIYLLSVPARHWPGAWEGRKLSISIPFRAS